MLGPAAPDIFVKIKIGESWGHAIDRDLTQIRHVRGFSHDRLADGLAAPFCMNRYGPGGFSCL